MSLFAPDLVRSAEALLAACRVKKLKITTAESCTGGLLAGLLTSIGGSSDVFERGFVTYSNESKMEMLGVSAQTLEKHGAVSAACAREMADGARRHSKADVSLSITGIAGPSGGSPEKPIGLVHFGCVGPNGKIDEVQRFDALGRDGIRLASVEFAVKLLQAQVE
jgi:nicotinamide-nucleotide amidase